MAGRKHSVVFRANTLRIETERVPTGDRQNVTVYDAREVHGSSTGAAGCNTSMRRFVFDRRRSLEGKKEDSTTTDVR